METQREYSPFELRVEEVHRVFQDERDFRLYVREEIRKTDEAHLAALEKLSNEAEQKMDLSKTSEGFSVYSQKIAYRGALQAYWSIGDEESAYKELIEKRDEKYEEQFNTEDDGETGLIHRKQFAPFRGEEKNTWQRYDSQRRVPLGLLILQRICGPWASEGDFEWLGALLGDRPGPIQWLPRKEELMRIKTLAKAIHEGPGLPGIIEIGCGTGLLSYLMAAEEELSVVGIDPDEHILLDERTFWTWSQDGRNNFETQAESYKHPNLKLIAGTSKTMLETFQDTPPDLVVSSWMPEDLNLMPDIITLKPKAIVLMYQDSDIYHSRFASPEPDYQKAYRWHGPDQQDVIAFSKVGNAESYGDKLHIDNGNVIEIWLRGGVDVALPERIRVPKGTKYPWEETRLEKVLVPYFWHNFTSPTYIERRPILEAGLRKLLKVEPMKRV